MVSYNINFNIDFDFEYNISKIIDLNENDFIGRSYLIINNVHNNWFPLFKKNQHLLCKIIKNLNKNIICPSYNDIFNAFTLNPDKIKIVLLGQDPYIKIGQAHGYSFSVPKNVKIPPSLKNIFEELENEYPNKYLFTNGNLELWSKNGIFLLNSALTTELGKSNVHANIWKEFTNNVIEYISENYSNKIFVLLGRNAQLKSILIDETKHCCEKHGQI